MGVEGLGLPGLEAGPHDLGESASMSRVTLIVPVVSGRLPAPSDLAEIRDALFEAGHELSILLLQGDQSMEDLGEFPETRVVDVGSSDLAGAALTGIGLAEGDYALVLDPRCRYPAVDFVAVVEALEADRGDVVVASRRCDWRIGREGDRQVRPRFPVGWIARWFTASSDPLSGLVGVRCDRIDTERDSGRAVGSMFTLELLARLPGVRADVPARPVSPLPPFRPTMDELRHIKRLADDRYGNFSRLVQFCLVGASGMVVDLSSYVILQWVFARSPLAGRSLPGLGMLDLAAAAVMAIGLALVWNFTLNRRLTFSYARQESRRKQFAAYVLSNALAVSVNLFLRLHLPRWLPFFDRHRLMAAVVGIVMATGLSFSMARWFVFRRRSGGPPTIAGDVESNVAFPREDSESLSRKSPSSVHRKPPPVPSA